jgi:hypothetical protein
MGPDKSANAKILDGQIFCATHSPRTERRWSPISSGSLVFENIAAHRIQINPAGGHH